MDIAANLITLSSSSAFINSSSFYSHGTSGTNHSALRPNSGGKVDLHDPPPGSAGIGSSPGQNQPLYSGSDSTGGEGRGGGSIERDLRDLRTMMTTTPMNSTMTSHYYYDPGVTKEAGHNFTADDLWQENEAYAQVLIPSMVYVIVLMLIGVPGNSLVVYVYGVQFRAATQHFLIVCLAVCDLVVGVIAMPTEIADLRFPFTFSSDFACRLLRFVNLFCSLTSNCVLVIIAVDRYRRVCRPLNHQMRMREAKVGAAVSVVVSLLISWPALVIMGLRTLKTSKVGLLGKGCSFSDEYYGTAYPMLLMSTLGAGFVVMTVVIAVLYFKIWRQTRAHSSRYQHHASRSFHHRHHRKKGRAMTAASPACSPPATPDPATGVPRLVSLAAGRLGGSVSPLATDSVSKDRASRAPHVQTDDTQPSLSSVSSSTSTSLCCCCRIASRPSFFPDYPVRGDAGCESSEARDERDSAHHHEVSTTRSNTQPHSAGKTSHGFSSDSSGVGSLAGPVFLEVGVEDDDTRCDRGIPSCECCEASSGLMFSSLAGAHPASRGRAEAGEEDGGTHHSRARTPCCECCQVPPSFTAATSSSSGLPGTRGVDACQRRSSFAGRIALQLGLVRPPRRSSAASAVYVVGVGDDWGTVSSRCCNCVQLSPAGSNCSDTSPKGSNSEDTSPARSNKEDTPARSKSVDMSPENSRDGVDVSSERSNDADLSSGGSNSLNVFPSCCYSVGVSPSRRRKSVEIILSPSQYSSSVELSLSRSKSVGMFPSLNTKLSRSRRNKSDVSPPLTNGVSASCVRCSCVENSPSCDHVNMDVSPSPTNNVDAYPVGGNSSYSCPRCRDTRGASSTPFNSVRTSPSPRTSTDTPPSPSSRVHTILLRKGSADLLSSRGGSIDGSPPSIPSSRSDSVHVFPSTTRLHSSRSNNVHIFPSPRNSTGILSSRSNSVDMRPGGGMSFSEENVSSSSKRRKFDSVFNRFRSLSSTDSDSISVITDASTITTATPSSYDDAGSVSGTEDAGRSKSRTCMRWFKGGFNMDKITLVAFAVTLVFVVSFLPYLTLMFVRGMFGEFDQSLRGSAEINAYNIFVRSYFLNYAANPVIYGVFNARFRRECVALFKKLTSCWKFLRRRHSERKNSFTSN